MERKYRQSGYQEEEREKRPKPPPRGPHPKSASSRVETRFQQITRCNNCAAEIQVVEQVQVTDKCKNCGTDLHTCRNCLNFDPAARNECVRPVEIRVTNKSANSICLEFEPKVLVEKQGSGAAPIATRTVNSHRQAFLDLFKK
jgi:hypothetical protein